MANAKKISVMTPAFRAMADLTRLKMLLMLEGRERTVGEIARFFALTQPTISRHLQTLQSTGLVRRHKQGQRVYYRLNENNMKSLCLDLVACFPCCCLTVSPFEKAGTKQISKRATPGRSGARSRLSNSTKKGVKL